MIFINSFREKLLDFCSYFKNYITLTLTLCIFLLIGLLLYNIYPNIGEIFISILALLIPVFFVHFVDDNSNDKKSIFGFKKNNSKENLRLIKLYIIKYLKSYSVFLLNLSISCVLCIMCMISFLSVQSSNLEMSIGLFLISFLSMFLSFEAFILLLSIPTAIVIQKKENAGIFKSIILGRRLLQKKWISHIFSVSSFAIFILPIIMISDKFYEYIYVSIFLRVLYVILVINFALFDIKKCIDKEDKSTLYKNKNSIFKLFKSLF